MWLSFVQAWVYLHFQGMGSKDVWAGYRERRDPRTMLFVPLSGLGTTDNYKNLLDRLDLSGVVTAPYGEHREARPFERVSLYFWMAEIRRPHGEISAGEGASSVWEGSDNPDTSHSKCTS